MTKKAEAPAAGAAPAAAASKAPSGDGDLSKRIENRTISRPVAGIAGGLRYSDPRHISRTLHDRGGPWTNNIVATHVADAMISKMMAEGYDLLAARHVTATPEGTAFFWLLAKPVGHAGSGLKEVKHVTRTIAGNLGAQPPAVTAFGADAYIAGFLNDGWSIFNFDRIASDPSGMSVMWVLVR